jgi:hypothetical protein
MNTHNSSRHLRAYSERTCSSCRRRAHTLDEYPTTCPVCAKPAYYSPDLDRWIHVDGSAMARCWAEMASGRVAV